ncbi:MAG: ABC transporter substrate-binding protein [Patescibacteria group bacterium]
MKKFFVLLGILLLTGGGFYIYKSQTGAVTKKQTAQQVYVINPGGETYGIFLDNFIKTLKASRPDGNVNITYKDALGDKDKLDQYIDEAIAQNPAIITTISSGPTFKITAKTKTIAVLTALGDPVEHGYVKTLQGSGFNLAGISQQNIELTPKRIELLKKAIPSIKKIAIVYDTTCGPTKKARPIANAQAPQLGVTLTEFPLTNPSKDDLQNVLNKITKKEFDAILFYPHGSLFSKADLFLKRSLEEKLPMIMPDETAIKSGAFASYGPDYGEMGRSLARIANKVLSGENPGVIPFEQPEKIEYIISVSNAKALGIPLNQETLGAATKVIQ